MDNVCYEPSFGHYRIFLHFQGRYAELQPTSILLTISKVYNRFPSLWRITNSTAVAPRALDNESSVQRAAERPMISLLRSWTFQLLPLQSLPLYFRHRVFVPSFALSLLYFTVLSFSGQMITYLIAVGYTSLYVGVARTISTVLELSATWIAPRSMSRIGIVRTGIWSICWQMCWLTAGVSWFLAQLYNKNADSIAAATGLAVSVALSRVGLWGYDLSAQNIIQDVCLKSNLRRSRTDHVTGGGFRQPREILHGRGRVPEPFRIASVRDDYHLFEARSISLAGNH